MSECLISSNGAEKYEQAKVDKILERMQDECAICGASGRDHYYIYGANSLPVCGACLANAYVKSKDIDEKLNTQLHVAEETIQRLRTENVQLEMEAENPHEDVWRTHAELAGWKNCVECELNNQPYRGE